jgi:hypothetical protein
MVALRDYEKKVISILTKDVLPRDIVNAVTMAGEVIRYEYTGVGYFLTLRHSSLPSERIVCDKPVLIGRGGGIQAGFVVFLENKELLLECHSWGDGSIPEAYRDQDVEIVAT